MPTSTIYAGFGICSSNITTIELILHLPSVCPEHILNGFSFLPAQGHHLVDRQAYWETGDWWTFRIQKQVSFPPPSESGGTTKGTTFSLIDQKKQVFPFIVKNGLSDQATLQKRGDQDGLPKFFYRDEFRNSLRWFSLFWKEDWHQDWVAWLF